MEDDDEEDEDERDFLKEARMSNNTLKGRLRHTERKSASLTYKVT